MKNNLISLQILIFSIFIVSIVLIFQGSKGFSLWDEGYLWYGAQRVMLGEVPIRDFMSYDPGRYYWSAILMNLWNDSGIISLRKSVAIFQVIGLFVGILLISQTVKKQNFIYLFLSSLILMIWMFPRHKLFDISLSIFLIGILTFLIIKPTSRRYFLTGICIGFIAFFGRNHGVYGVVASLGVMFWLNINKVNNITLFYGVGLWAIGIVIGFSPILFMLLFVPDFMVAFLDSILFLFEIKATNFPLPIPWPWNIDFLSISIGNTIRAVLIGLFFIAILIFGILSIMWVVWKKYKKKEVPPVLVAASFLAIPYTHYAYSRADINHLAQGIFPFLIGCLVLFSIQKSGLKWLLISILCGSSFWVMHINHSGWYCYSNRQCETVKIYSDELLVRSKTINDIKLLRNLAKQYTPNGQNFIVTPFWPGAYPLLEQKSPIWEIFALFPRNRSFEMEEIEKIKMAKPGFILVSNKPLDGHEKLRYKNTHPLTYKYIVNNFEKISYSSHLEYEVFKEKKYDIRKKILINHLILF